MSATTEAVSRRLAPFATPQGLRGNLSALPLAELIVHLRRTAASGILSVEFEGTRKAVYFREGRVSFATSNSPNDRLGETLLRMGRISVDEYDASVKLISHGKRQGKALIEMGAMGPKDLWDGLETQVRDIVFSLFEWSEGEFSFDSTTLPQKEKVTVSFDALELLLEGLRRIDPEGALKGRYPDPALILSCVRDAETGLLEAYERHVLSLVDGQRSVEEVCRESEIGEAETQKSLYALFCGGFVRVSGRKIRTVYPPETRDPAEAALAAYNSMYGYIHRYLLREVGPEADARLSAAVSELHAGGGLLSACVVAKGGELEVAPLLQALGELGADERSLQLTNALNEVLYAMLFAVRSAIGSDHEANILKALRPERMLVEV